MLHFPRINRRKRNFVERTLDGYVAVYGYEFFAEQSKFLVVCDVLSEFAGDLLGVCQNVFERAVFVEKLFCSLFANARYTGDVVRRIAAKCLVVYKLFDGKSVFEQSFLVVHFDVAYALLCPKNLRRGAYELKTVSVARDDNALVVKTLGQRAENVVALVAFFAHDFDTHRGYEVFERLDLLAQLLVHRLSCRLVFLVHFVAERRTVQVESRRYMCGILLFDYLQKYAQKAVYRARVQTLGGFEIGKRVIRAVHKRVRIQKQYLVLRHISPIFYHCQIR